MLSAGELRFASEDRLPNRRIVYLMGPSDIGQGADDLWGQYKLVNKNAVPYPGVWESATISEKIEPAFAIMQRSVLHVGGGLRLLWEGARHGRIRAGGEEVPAPSVDQ